MQEQLADLRADSASWRAERHRHAQQRNPYQYDMSVRTIEQLVPNKKDLPIYLNWPFNSIPCRACADFGAAANIIDANYAREINVNIIPDIICEPFELPTYGRLIWPIGRARITCAFPGEADTINDYDFFVFENFVYPVIMGREFLRETGTLDKFQHRLHDRPIVKREIPIVASLGVEEETLTAFVAGEKLDSFPDTGSEINVMSLEFAKRRGFTMVTDDIHTVCFANGSLQDIVGRVTVPVSFSNGKPPNVLLKLVDQLSVSENRVFYNVDETRQPTNLENITIEAEFYVLDGLRNSIILGEDLLASVNAFVCLSGNFKPVTLPESLYPALATMGLLRKAGKRAAAMIGRTAPETRDPVREQDIADSKELDRYEREQERIRGLPEQERELATWHNARIRREYIQKRYLFGPRG
jgi:hypothetical protein